MKAPALSRPATVNIVLGGRQSNYPVVERSFNVGANQPFRTL